MKIALPSSENLIKSIIVAIVLATIGFFISPYLNIASLSSAHLISYSLLIGSFIGAIIVTCPMEMNLPGSQQVSVFVGNLAFKAGAQDLRDLFSKYGEVQGVRVMTDRATRRPKGFAFVEMDQKGAKSAIASLDNAEFFGREIKVNYATRRKQGT